MAQSGSATPFFATLSSQSSTIIQRPPLSRGNSTLSGQSSPNRNSPNHDASFKMQSARPKSRVVKRSESTPHLEVLISTSSGPESPEEASEKKRNKLGYNRTTVACGQSELTLPKVAARRPLSLTPLGHCRKRKIRCQPPPDQTGKCSNCVRLKKDCTYYPIEQPVALEPSLRHQVSGEATLTNAPVPSLSPNPPGSEPSQSQPYGNMTGLPTSLSPDFNYHRESVGMVSPPEGEHFAPHLP